MKNSVVSLLTLCSLLFCFSTITMANSESDYTYQKDRKFSHINQLNGQVFIPQEVEEGRSERKKVAPGAVKVSIAPEMVFFEGIEGLGAMNIVAKNNTPLGFEFRLVDRRGVEFPKFKVILDKHNFVQLIYFHSKKYGEYTFFLPKKTKAQLQKEANYFTRQDDFTVKVYNDLVGKAITPYTRINNVNNKFDVEEKIPMVEAFNIKFKEDKVVFNMGKSATVYDIKKVKINTVEEKIEGKPYPLVYDLVEIRMKEKGKKMVLKLSEDREPLNITFSNAHYFLMKRRGNKNANKNSNASAVNQTK